ncbi:MAG: SpoIID/LytB domain-containing protein [Thermosynechococcaceae cyanobacterium MS004]|nr:SpoIID/LytB domain-containing protein [Thermosynechococcaceae cyanobacterium MS004]
MNFSALSFLKSLRIWHVAPLCLPFLLGSAKLQGSAPPTTPTAIAPPPFTVAQLLAQEGIFVSKSSALQPQLPSQALTAFTKGQLGSSQRYQSKQEPGQESEPVQQTQNLQTQNAQTAASVPSRHEAALALGEAPKPATNLPPIPLRVAIARNVDTVAIATSDAGVVTDQSGRVLGSLSPQTAVTAFPSNTGLQVGSWQTPSVVWVKPRSPNGLVYIGERWYRGSVQLLQVSGKVLAVNYVDLESYLYSVVGAEMPASWPAQALKAQAIAARSYAVVHMTRPAGDHYDLGATPRWQAYSGVESEAESTQLAVNATRGLLISYQGGVVESLYASTDQIVQEAHSGFGMSQNGANQLALKNFSYQQILSHFYPGTGLAVLNVK